MGITIAQFNVLAERYGFDINEARAYIGLPPSSNRGRPPTESSEYTWATPPSYVSSYYTSAPPCAISSKFNEPFLYFFR